MSQTLTLGIKLTKYGSSTMALILRDQRAAVRDTKVMAKLQGINGAIELAMTRVQ